MKKNSLKNGIIINKYILVIFYLGSYFWFFYRNVRIFI